MRSGIHMAYAETGDTGDYLVARNNMLQDSTVALGAVTLNTLADMPEVAKIGIWGVAGAFVLSTLRFAAHLHFIKQNLRDTGEW